MEFPKIETLFERDEHFKVIPSKLRNSSYGLIKKWQFTEKIHGMNLRMIWQEGKLKFGGRTGNAQLPADLIQHLYEIVDINKLREVFPDTHAIVYGEGYGAGIQTGGSYSKTKSFIVFDVLIFEREYDKIRDGLKGLNCTCKNIPRWWLNWENVCDVAAKLGLDTVPFLGEWTLEEGIEFVRKGFDSLLAKSKTGEIVPAEGIVGRTCETMYDKQMQRMIIKLKTRDF